MFTHVLLADEINRAPAKTQSALLEVMQEYQVTLEGQTLPLPKPFMVLATQNPIETEGTYPLPEAQLDRFLFKIEIGYPSSAEEVAIVVRATTDQAGDELPLADVKPCLDAPRVSMLQQLAAQQRVDEQVIDYAVRIVRATRDMSGLAMGSGSRGALALVRGARAVALLDGRGYVDAGRRQAHRAARAAPPRRARAGCAARRPHGERSAGRGHRDRRGAARLTPEIACMPSRDSGPDGGCRARGDALSLCSWRC